MERIDESPSKQYLPLVIFLDDLQAIERFLKDSCSSVRFEAAGYRFDSWDEFVSQTKMTNLRTVDVVAHDPFVHIDLERMWANLRVGTSADQGAAIFYKLDHLLSQRLRTLKWLYSYQFIFAMNAIVWLWNRFIPKSQIGLGLSASLASFAWVLWVLFIRIYRHSIIILKRRGEQGSFFERNKDNLVVAVIAAAVGALIGVAATVFVNGMKK